MKITTVGVDLAKSVFTVYGVDEHGKPALRKTVRRGKLLELFAQLPACVVGMEACSGAQHWARELRELGHTPRIMAAEFVEPYRRGGKNDTNDAAAICEAVARPQMRFVPIKSVEQQAVLAVHRLRQGLGEERTALANRIRGLLTEYGLVIGVGLDRLRKALPSILEDAESGVPGIAREVFADATRQLIELDARIGEYDRRIAALARASEPAQRLMKMEGVGPVTATAIVASVGDAKMFRNGRQFAAWLGLTPRQHSTGGKQRLGAMTKHGDVYLRTLLIHGARAVLRVTPTHSDAKSRWAESLRHRRPDNVAAVALAAKHARIIWALLARGQHYRPAV
ncbi:MAG TPA: IS110 family transposase [Gemmatimonadales bacterium]|nr:IS110 family transposase [Gemmatimonadales bacterium]